MLIAIGTLVAADRVEKHRLGQLEVAEILRHHRQIVHPHGDAWVIVAESAAIDLERAFVSLLGERPLLLAHVNLCEVVQHGGNVGGGSGGAFQDVQAAVVEFLGIDEPALLVAQYPERPQRAPGLLAGRAEVALREMQCLLQRRLRAGEIARVPVSASEFQQGGDARSVVRRRLQRQRLGQSRQRLLVLAEAVVNGADRRQQRRLGRGLIRKSGLQAFGTRVQQFPGGDLVAAILLRIG